MHKKTVFLIRHAKSDQHTFSNDLERPLNNRGLSDAPEMAKRLKKRQPVLNAIICSPAKRTRTTAAFFAAEYGIPAEEVTLASALYLADKETILEVISNLPDELQHVAIIAHNPGLSYFADSVADGVAVANMPTCSIFAFTAGTSRWKELAKAAHEFLFFDYPKLQQ